MQERIDPRRRHVGVDLNVIIGVDESVRIAVLREANAVEMGFGILADTGSA